MPQESKQYIFVHITSFGYRHDYPVRETLLASPGLGCGLLFLAVTHDLTEQHLEGIHGDGLGLTGA